MEGLDSARADRRRFLAAIVLVLMVGLLAPPVVQAAARATNVRAVKKPVKIADTKNGEIDSESIPPLGTSQAPGSSGAVAVRTFAGGGGLLGAGNCGAGPTSVNIAANTDRKITAIIITGSGALINVAVGAPLNIPSILTLRTTAGNSNTFIGLGNGLTVTPSPLTFSCTGPFGASSADTQFVLLGQ
jgi:hypothetical protein